jgi:hypothetical protein
MTNVKNVIATLKAIFENDPFHLDFSCAMMIAGNGNKELRRAIMKELTGEDLPLSRCGLGSVQSTLEESFNKLPLNP